MSDRFSIDHFETAIAITDDHFGVVLKSSAIPQVVNGARDWQILDKVITESGASSIRFPGGTEGWRDFDFTDRSDIINLQAVIDYCAKNGLSLQFTASLRQFFIEPEDSDEDGALNMSEEQEIALRNFIEVDLLDYAQGKGVDVLNIQLDNEPLHRDLDGEFLNHREYSSLANTYAAIVGPIIKSHQQNPNLIVVSAASEGRFNGDGEAVYGGAWGIRAIINGFINEDGASYIDGIDLHAGDVTLHPEYEDIFGTDSDSSSFYGASLYDGLNWQIENWKRDTTLTETGIGSLEFHVSAWSLPQANEGGGSLRNAGISILQMHSYSAVGISSATNYTLLGGDANALFSFSGIERAGGAIFGMMANSLKGLTAVNLEPNISNQERAASSSLIEGFLGSNELVVYVINRTEDKLKSSLDFNDLINELPQFINGISSISGAILGVAKGDDPTNAYAEAQVRDWGVDSKNFDGLTASFELGAYEIMEFKITHNELNLPISFDIGEDISHPSLFVNTTGSSIGGFNDDTFLMGGGSGFIDGGGGTDTLSFLNAPEGVIIWGEGYVEVGLTVIEFTNFEKVQGSIFSDRIVIDGDNIQFFGEGGDDILDHRSGSRNVLNGGMGNDTFIFYDSADVSVFGGEGDDEFVFFGSLSNVDILPENRVLFNYSQGDGSDVIRGFDENIDRIIFDGLKSSDISVYERGMDTVIQSDEVDIITLTGHFSDSLYSAFDFV
ncbi:hypothetical protein [Pseudorhodobacter turbinis]|nr:hypothetical protein [Pseudorhodobacter turbinis]